MRCVFVRSNWGERLAILLSTSQDKAILQLLDLNGEDSESLRCKGILLCKVSKTIVDVPITSILRDVLILKRSLFELYIYHQLGTEVFAILDVDIPPKYSNVFSPVSDPLLGLEGMKENRRIYLNENKLSVMTTNVTKLMNIIKSASWTSLQGLSAYLTSQLNDFASYYTSQCLKEFCELVNIDFSPSMTLTVTDFISKLITKLINSQV
jgi:hypothetical protein